MKTIVTGILFLVVLFSFNTPKINFPKAKTVYTEFRADSGYIKKGEALRLLAQAKYDLGYEQEGRDTLDLQASNYKFSDTLGKYYKIDNGNYLAFLPEVTHPDRRVYLLMETTRDGIVLRSEPYWSGMYQCCWDKPYEGIERYGNNYFGILSCGTGSAHCSSNIHLFKGFAPQSNSICSYLYTGWCVGREIACLLTSDMEIKNDTVTMHYTMEHLKERRNGKYKTVDSEKFDIKYVEREQGWVALDSTKIYEFPN
ncbi:hypothetical protein AAEO56_02900 [Flavobacterium sp. DGU11]|uniref:GLPGLI family protein n=1 Tax=Flavobacterium arundinis TaxID=3139143 RepID=A0ABU9HSQ7_9FLAO